MTRAPFVALFAVLLCASAESARAVPRSIVDRNYDCKIIASTRELPLGVTSLGPPAMNTWGQVVFMTQKTVGNGTVFELRVGRGELSNGGVPITHAVAKAGETIDGPLGPFASIEKAAIDDAARVTFLAYELSATGGQGIYRVFTDHAATAKPSPLYASHPFNTGDDYIGFGTSTLDANAEGSIVFEGTKGNYEDGYRRNGTVFARNYTNGVGFVNSTTVRLHAGQPWTAFSASLDAPETGQGVWVNGSRRLQSLNGEGGFDGLSLSGNGSAVIAYTRSGFAGIDTWELAITGPINTSVYVDADEDPFEPNAHPRETSINVWSDVAFISSPEGDGDTLLVADGSQQIRRVICQNQQQDFEGQPFFDYALSPHAINADGQIAFMGRTGFDTFLMRADPLPGEGAPPSDCTGQDEGARCDDGDPITQSSCQSNACGGNPLYDPPTSCLGLGNDTACNDGDPETISYCDDGVCVGMPLPVPEPGATVLAIAAGIGLASLRRAR
jgi:hypothetical protein